jgi:argininosuccinate lyase
MAEKKEARLRGRFKEEINAHVQRFVASVPFDWRLYRHDIAGSLAHAEMLARQGIISRREFGQIKEGLKSILTEIENGEFVFKLELEDVHMNIESRLFELIGDTAGKLHTARSRNDQVALDLRLFTREAIRGIALQLQDFNVHLVDVAARNIRVIMPGYTHLQQAQPVLFSHWLMSYYQMFGRDIQRFNSCLERVNILPLGSGALAGLPYPIDREFVARKLGFDSVSANSIDSVSDRDFAVEFESAAAIAMMHLSRMAEDVIIWSTQEFGFIEIGDSYATSSSIMPQKKNPDTAELVRGKTGRVYGHLLGLLTVLKGLPQSYNRDLQEDKEGLFDTVDTLASCITVMQGLVSSIKVNVPRMESSMHSYILATDIADYLVGKGMSFRDAHGVVARLVAWCTEQGKELDRLDTREYRRFSDKFEADVKDISLRKSVEARTSPGGTATSEVRKKIDQARQAARADKKENN